MTTLANKLTPLYRSKFGGLWVDRTDAETILARKLREGEITSDDVEPLRYYIKQGYVIFPGAVATELLDQYIEFFERAWKEPPPGIYAHSGDKVLPLSETLYNRIAKVSDLHYYFKRAGEIIFPRAVKRFLTQIYERPPVVFQSMSMRKGTEESLHTDTGPLTLTEPMSLTASWIALEDVRAGSGPLQFIPGSHRIPEVLNNGVSKGHNGDMTAYYSVLQANLDACKKSNLPTEHFMAKKGDVLVWSADLMHGGAKIDDLQLTRKSLVCHYMPLGVMATFYDFSTVHYLEYPQGGWYLDRIKPKAY